MENHYEKTKKNLNKKKEPEERVAHCDISFHWDSNCQVDWTCNRDFRRLSKPATFATLRQLTDYHNFQAKKNQESQQKQPILDVDKNY